MTEPTVAAGTEQADAPQTTIFRPGGTKGWVQPNVPGVVTVANNRNGDNPRHETGKYQYKRQGGAWTPVSITWNRTDNYNTNGQDFSLKNTGTVTMTANP